jgi:mxaJ protein
VGSPANVPNRVPPSVRVERLLLAVPALVLAAIAVARQPSAVARLAPTRLAVAAVVPGAPPAPARRVLRVCADPNNLPFTNQRGEGFENRLAELVARELGAELRYTWWAQRRGFFRNTLRAGTCDLVTGVPTSVEMVLATRPYYRSTYVFVYRKGARFRVRSFDDPVLRTLRVGVQIIGDDYANAPPAHALSARGIVRNVVGFSVYGNYADPSPPARIVEAVARDSIDVAIVWGPLGGYFASRQRVPLEVVPVSPQIDVPFLPFVYDISMGVRRDDPGLRDEVEDVLRRRSASVDSILDAYHVPRVSAARRARRPAVP